jgi:hypothetical protein
MYEVLSQLCFLKPMLKFSVQTFYSKKAKSQAKSPKAKRKSPNGKSKSPQPTFSGSFINSSKQGGAESLGRGMTL